MNNPNSETIDAHIPHAQLLILRSLQQDHLRRQFVSLTQFKDNDLAQFLGLGHWLSVKISKFDRKAIFAEMDALLNRLELQSPSMPETCRTNCRLLTAQIGLDPIESEILEAMVLFTNEQACIDLFSTANPRNKRDYIHLLGIMLRRPEADLRKATSPAGSLVSCGLIEWSKTRSDRPSLEFCISALAENLFHESCTVKTILSSMLMPTPEPTLKYTDYPHIKQVLADLRAHVRRALKHKQRGVNVYIHGRPGTGKSELSRVIAREMRATLYEVSFEDSDGDPVHVAKRLESLRASQTLLKKRRSMIVFDEAEDVFCGDTIFERSIASRRKAWINRIFESNEIPTFWISNTADLDPAFFRRFDFILHLEAPPKEQRARSYRRIFGKKVSPHLVEKIANFDSLTAGVVAKATQVARGIHQDPSSPEFEVSLMRQIKQTLTAQGVNVKRLEQQSEQLPGLYRIDYLNCDLPLATLPESLSQNASCRMCLYGPPGTGKTTLGYWLAKETNKKIHIKKASDLLGPYLGQTEQNIAAAFENAARDGAILMIDEVDSFLQDRGQAVRGWEVQQVNELLTQMEHFDGIFIASTNLMEGIDQAALRRFDLKLRFDYLHSGQCQQLLVSSCGELKLVRPDNQAIEVVTALTNATPGDFANCRRQARFKHFDSPLDFANAVAGECRIKADKGGRRLGFDPSR